MPIIAYNQSPNKNMWCDQLLKMSDGLWLVFFFSEHINILKNFCFLFNGLLKKRKNSIWSKLKAQKNSELLRFLTTIIAMIYYDLSSQSLNLYSIHTSYKLISNIYSLFSKFYNVCVAFTEIITSGYDYISLSLIRTENSCVSLFLNMLSRKSIYKQTNKQNRQIAIFISKCWLSLYQIF